MSFLLAVPSALPGGLESKNAAHFGHCDCYTLVEIEDKTVRNVSTLASVPHRHGACMTPVKTLTDKGVKVLLSAGMGERPLAGFTRTGVDVYRAAGCGTVQDAVQAYLDGKLSQFTTDMACKGHHDSGHGAAHGNCHGMGQGRGNCNAQGQHGHGMGQGRGNCNAQGQHGHGMGQGRGNCNAQGQHGHGMGQGRGNCNAQGQHGHGCQF